MSFKYQESKKKNPKTSHLLINPPLFAPSNFTGVRGLTGFIWRARKKLFYPYEDGPTSTGPPNVGPQSIELWTHSPLNYGPHQVEKSKGGLAVSGEKGMEPPPALGRDGRQIPPVTKQGRVEVEMTSVPKTAVPSQTRQTQATTHATESPSHVDACLLSSSFPHLLLLSSDSLGLLKKS